MKQYIKLDDNNRLIGIMPGVIEEIDATTGGTIITKNEIEEPWFEFDVPEEIFESEFLDDWVYQNESFIFDENQERIQENLKGQQRFQAMQDLPDTLADTDEAVCDLYEENESLNAIIAEQDSAICELYEMFGE